MKSEEDQIDRDNVSKLIRGEFDFSPQKMLSKTLILDTTKIDENKIMDLTIGPLNDEIKWWILCWTSTWIKLFYLETRRWKIKNY